MVPQPCYMLTMFILPFSRSANVQDVLYDARVYSYYLSQFWNVSTCDANTLLLYSKDDDIVSYKLTVLIGWLLILIIS